MAVVNVRYEPSDAGWKRIKMSPEILGFCLAEAKRGEAYAISVSPVSGEQRQDKYIGSFQVEPETVSLYAGDRRVAARLSNSAPHAAAVEFSNAQMPNPQRILGQTAAFIAST